VKLQLRIYPDPILREKAEAVDTFDDELRRLAEDMIETMHVERGIGLAAPQVGDGRRLIVAMRLEDPEDTEGEALVFVNPRVTFEGGDFWTQEEGCLSIPGVSAPVNRRSEIEVDYQDLDGNPHSIAAEGMFARVLLHEIDHLNGVLFIDHLSTAQKSLIKGQLKKFTES
jgi:peptide deformylase